MCDVCGDNRFELIEKYKKALMEATNIESSKDEMDVIDNILFRFWQMGWLVQPRKTAEWIYGEKDGADGWYCSKCGFHIPWYYDYYGLNNINFIRDFHTCPHCDSKMMKYTGMDLEELENAGHIQ